MCLANPLRAVLCVIIVYEPLQIENKTTSDCVQLYYFWKKLSIDYKVTNQVGNEAPVSVTPNTTTAVVAKTATTAASNHSTASHAPTEMRAHVCDMPDCSAVSSETEAIFSTISPGPNNEYMDCFQYPIIEFLLESCPARSHPHPLHCEESQQQQQQY